jgi:hypothetical protein
MGAHHQTDISPSSGDHPSRRGRILRSPVDPDVQTPPDDGSGGERLERCPYQEQEPSGGGPALRAESPPLGNVERDGALCWTPVSRP